MSSPVGMWSFQVKRYSQECSGSFCYMQCFSVHPCIFWVNHNSMLLMYKYIWGDFFLFFFKTFKICGPFLKVFIEFVTVLLLFYVLGVWSQGMWGLSSPTRNQTCTACIGKWGLNHWTIREVPPARIDNFWSLFFVGSFVVSVWQCIFYFFPFFLGAAFLPHHW